MSEMQRPFRTLWRFEPELNNQVSGRSVAACNGKIYVIGGKGSENSDYSSYSEVFDPDTNIWGTMPAPPKHFGPHPAVVSHGNTLIVGSQNNGLLLFYDTTASTWRSVPFPEWRKDYSLAVVNDKIYIIGGAKSSGSTYNNTLIYNLAIDQWETPIRFSGKASRVVVVGDRVFYDTAGTWVSEYNLATGISSNYASGPWESNGKLGGAVVIGTDIYYFSTRHNYNGKRNRDMYRSMYVLDTLTGTITKNEHMPVCWWNNLAVLLNDRVYLIQEDIAVDLQDMISISVEALTTGEETDPEEGEDMYMMVRMKDTSLLSGTRDLQNPGSWQPGKTLFNI